MQKRKRKNKNGVRLLKKLKKALDIIQDKSKRVEVSCVHIDFKDNKPKISFSIVYVTSEYISSDEYKKISRMVPNGLATLSARGTYVRISIY